MTFRRELSNKFRFPTKTIVLKRTFPRPKNYCYFQQKKLPIPTKADHQKLPTKYNLPLTSDKLLKCRSIMRNFSSPLFPLHTVLTGSSWPEFAKIGVCCDAWFIFWVTLVGCVVAWTFFYQKKSINKLLEHSLTVGLTWFRSFGTITFPFLVVVAIVVTTNCPSSTFSVVTA